jgi:hypothetical protein
VTDFDAAKDAPVLIHRTRRHLVLSELERLTKESKARAKGHGAHVSENSAAAALLAKPRLTGEGSVH